MKRFKNFDILTDREQDVIRVMYFGMKDTLGLSPEYFQEVLNSARAKEVIKSNVKGNDKTTRY
jgi:hypothetical protein